MTPASAVWLDNSYTDRRRPNPPHFDGITRMYIACSAIAKLQRSEL